MFFTRDDTIGVILFKLTCLLTLSSGISTYGPNKAAKDAITDIQNFCKSHNTTCQQQKYGTSLTDAAKDSENPLLLFCYIFLGNLLCGSLSAILVWIRIALKSSKDTHTTENHKTQLSKIFNNQIISTVTLSISLFITGTIVGLIQAGVIQETICESRHVDENNKPLKCANIERSNNMPPADIDEFSAFSKNQFNQVAKTSSTIAAIFTAVIFLFFLVPALHNKCRNDKSLLKKPINDGTFGTYGAMSHIGDTSL